MDIRDLIVAVRYFSGGTVTVSENDQHWRRLLQMLLDNNLSPYEYVYWLVYSSGQSLADTAMDINPGLLHMRNVVCSPQKLNQFISWKAHNDGTLVYLVASQQAKLENNLALGIDLVTMLMNDFEELSAPLRCEEALRRVKDKATREAVFHKYGEMARTLLLGMPAYQKFVPRTTKWVDLWLTQVKSR